jgi:phosphohistidine phosphatase
MRHGPAEDDAPSGRDFDRRLTARGRERTERVARALARRSEPPRRILCSPLVRTVETAEVVSAIVGLGDPERRDDLTAGSDLFRSAVEWAREAGPLLIVGHEPDLSMLTTRLCPEWAGRYDKAMVVGLAAEVVGSGDAVVVAATVEFTIDPKQPDN